MREFHIRVTDEGVLYGGESVRRECHIRGYIYRSGGEGGGGGEEREKGEGTGKIGGRRSEERRRNRKRWWWQG